MLLLKYTKELILKLIIIHCSATPDGRETTAADIHQWHSEPPRNWSGIGYHYVIKLDGTVEAGRPEYWQGAHASGHNEDSIGICMIGTERFTVNQYSSLKNKIKRLQNKYPNIKVIGHNQVSDKTCPGFNVQEWLIHQELI
jgi:N-acetylmuramoyl-L-alanine amidase